MNCTNNPVTFADLNSRICVSSCTAPTYADEILGICVSNCSVNTYFMAYNTNDRRCVKVCYPNFYANSSRVCVAATSCPSSNVTYYGDDSTGLCVKSNKLVMKHAQSEKEPSLMIKQGNAYITVLLEHSQNPFLENVWVVRLKSYRMPSCSQLLR